VYTMWQTLLRWRRCQNFGPKIYDMQSMRC